MILLDGPMGTQLEARGIALPLPAWTAHAVAHHPERISEIHREYAAAGATVHTAATFRTRKRTVGAEWIERTRRAVRLAFEAVPPEHRVAGSIAPLEDCYRPDLSPPEPRAEHREFAQFLASTGVDLLLCETFCHPSEALVAVEEAVATGLETWLALTAGPSADLMTPGTLFATARHAVRAGASAILVNCIRVDDTSRFLEPLAALGVPFGAYANAGPSEAPDPIAQYVEHARSWVDRGASVLGSCCGTSPAHIAALRDAFCADVSPR